MDIMPTDCDAFICIVPHRKPNLVWPSHLEKRFKTTHRHIPVYGRDFLVNGHHLDQLLWDVAWTLTGSPVAPKGSQEHLRFDLAARARQLCTAMQLNDFQLRVIDPPAVGVRPTRGKVSKKRAVAHILHVRMRPEM